MLLSSGAPSPGAQPDLPAASFSPGSEAYLSLLTLPFSSGLRPNKQTFNPADTNALVAAVAFGKGLSNWRPSGSSGPGQPGQPGAGTILAGASGLQQVQMAGAPNQQQPLLSGVQMAQAGQTGEGAGNDMVADLENGNRNKLHCLSPQHPRAIDFLLFFLDHDP